MSIPEQNSGVLQSGQSKIERVFVVFNPVAGLTKADTARETILKFCETMEWQCDIHETKPDEDVRQLVKDAVQTGVDMVIASGGDGTVSAVVSGMVNSNVPMGILPAGTGNALARDLGIPLDLEEALAVFSQEHDVRVLDIMETNGSDYWALNVSVGVSAMTMNATKREEKRRFGMLAYVWRALGLIKNSDMHRFRITVDGKKYAFSASEVMVANTKLFGLQMQLNGVEIDANDGVFDLFIVRADSAKDYVGVLTSFMREKGVAEEPNLRYLPVKDRVEITSEFPLPVQADGEVIGDTPVTIRLIPSALRVIVPIPEPESGEV